MSHSFTADNKLTQPRNNASTTLSVAVSTTLPQSMPGGILKVQFPFADAPKFYNHSYLGRQRLPTSAEAHGYLTIDTQMMWFDGITTVGSNRRFQVTKRKINIPSALAHDVGRRVQQRVVAQHMMQMQAILSSISGRFSTSGERGQLDLSNSSFGYQYVGSKYNVGKIMYDSVTDYINTFRGGGYVLVNDITDLRQLISASATCTVVIIGNIIGTGDLVIPLYIDIAGFYNGAMFKGYDSVTIGKMSYNGLCHISECPLAFESGAVKCIYPQWYGAMGDGITDDTIAIKLAVEENKEIFFPEGRYKITSTIFVNSFFGNERKLIGAGSGKTILQFAPSNTSYSSITIDATGLIVTLSGNTFDTDIAQGYEITIDTAGTPEIKYVSSKVDDTHIILSTASTKTGQSGLACSIRGNFAVWFGNHTQDTPTSIYQCLDSQMSGFNIECKKESNGALRCREIQHGLFLDLRLGPTFEEPLGSDTKGWTALCVDGGINSKFDLVDCRPIKGYDPGDTTLTTAASVTMSLNLARTTGSGDGAGVTTIQFNNCYFHYARNCLNINSTNACNFNNCIFQSCMYGVVIAASGFPININNGYWQNIIEYPVFLNGTDVLTTSSAIINGGMYQARTKVGAISNDGYTADTFIGGNYFGKLSVKDVFFASEFGQKSILINRSQVGKMEIQANNGESILNPYASVSLSSHNIITTSGSNLIKVQHTNHGLTATSAHIIALGGHTNNIQGGLEINSPFFRVMNVVDKDNYEVMNLFNSNTSTSSTTANHSYGEVSVYHPYSWLNCYIPYADSVILSDCNYEQHIFSETFTSDGVATDLKYGYTNDDNIRYVIIEEWFYIIKASVHRSLGGGAIAGAYLQVELPNSKTPTKRGFGTISINETGLIVTVVNEIFDSQIVNGDQIVIDVIGIPETRTVLNRDSNTQITLTAPSTRTSESGLHYTIGTVSVDGTGKIVTISNGTFNSMIKEGYQIDLDTAGTEEVLFVSSRDSSTQLTLKTASAKTNTSGLYYAIGNSFEVDYDPKMLFNINTFGNFLLSSSETALGYKLPPKTKLSFRMDPSKACTMQAKLTIAKTGIKCNKIL